MLAETIRDTSQLQSDPGSQEEVQEDEDTSLPADVLGPAEPNSRDVKIETNAPGFDFDDLSLLKKHEKRTVKSSYVGDITMYVISTRGSEYELTRYSTFDDAKELNLHGRTLLPKAFYRTFYETSATLSRYVTVDTHTKHRKHKDLKIEDGNAFQSIAGFSIHEYLKKECIEQHLIWNQREHPSAYISTFDHMGRRSFFGLLC